MKQGLCRHSLSIAIEKKRALFPKIRLRREIDKILQALHFPNGTIQISLLSDAQIRKINRKFLNHDFATDVISFGYLDTKKGRRQSDAAQAPRILGDIAISLDTARRQAREYGVDYFYEVVFYVCHGLLHILGWDDRTASMRTQMLAKQAQILRQTGLSPSLITKLKKKT